MGLYFGTPNVSGRQTTYQYTMIERIVNFFSRHIWAVWWFFVIMTFASLIGSGFAKGYEIIKQTEAQQQVESANESLVLFKGITIKDERNE